jgi:hypothetical protein
VDSCLAPLSVASTSIDARSTRLAAPRKVRMTANRINRDTLILVPITRFVKLFG